MKNIYWYLDNWNSGKKTFESLKEAIKSAKVEYGNYISIFDQSGRLVKIVNASGYVPA